MCSIPMLQEFVWRQSGFAFFGALTSVGALFCFVFLFGKETREKRCVIKQKWNNSAHTKKYFYEKDENNDSF